MCICELYCASYRLDTSSGRTVQSSRGVMAVAEQCGLPVLCSSIRFRMKVSAEMRFLFGIFLTHF
jgi:hypothetical protein